jgi:hypothetical protein
MNILMHLLLNGIQSWKDFLQGRNIVLTEELFEVHVDILIL